ncbi:MAG: nitrate reductase gamma subunit [Moorella sp. (in: firmicutes)]|jgi:nitrate reductase gamma subunit|uniref:sulfate reduction electron transfer complex DsrMKJOP subunit DsrM n=1 Tax=unclassified Neomoorella TaxID=2676739 RepID=UPI0010FFC363|nr:sulfate reduction electron transfer complex DsrMKJOP subunit DsrM [Moorella sp. E306M]MDK2816938.1 nitrate reductase gamma subunit [Moorella sp. (in: firmicutes)]MDK2894683.1 nitrate reductase gamma subunit [Moorella sp. (in: firmicutes)]GEA16043.1 nitrate reductase subunit gamma [Moorella sp. E308F]GEA19114.1 nitrate reductase subunit gamma [Moorella sp. E306M]
MGMAFSFFGVIVLMLVVYLGAGLAGWHYLFGVIIPYAAIAIFLAGMAYRVIKWARVPVPFRIPTTAGQQKSLPWIKASTFDNPSSTAGVIGRIALEVLFFRSLLRNTRMELHRGPRLAYHWEKWLWLGGLLFHWSFLIIFLRHLRFFTEPVPAFVSWLEAIDGFFRFGLQGLYITDIVILVAVTYLFLRRVVIPQVRYISLPADYLPLFLILGIASTGILMRYFFRVDITAVKELTIGLVTFRPRVPEGIGVLFYIHLFLVCILGAYFPFSKLVHMGGIFLSPTRNLPNDSRARRHINPWNYPVKVHTYEEYEEEFREKMKMAGLPVEKG